MSHQVLILPEIGSNELISDALIQQLDPGRLGVLHSAQLRPQLLRFGLVSEVLYDPHKHHKL